MRLVRAVFSPPGSPRISLAPMLWLTRPGSGVEAARWITQPTMRSVGMARDSLPPGSSDSRRAVRAVFRPWKNHHGTPFIAVTTEVSGPSNGAMASATSVRLCALTVTNT